MTVDDRRVWIRDGGWAAGLMASRVLLMVGLGAALKWADPSDDVSFQLVYAERPLVLLGLSEVGEGEYLPPFPPLLPVVLWVFWSVGKLALTGAVLEFLAMRLGYAVMEAIGLVATRAALRASGLADKRSMLMASVGWLLMPVGWMSVSVMCQEEAVSVAFAAVMVWLIVTKRVEWALLVAGFGVVTGKVYFLVPIAGMVLAGGWSVRELAKRGLCGFGPVFGVYAIVATFSGGVALAGFTPIVDPSISLWGLAPRVVDEVDNDALKKVSALPALVLGMLPIVLARVRLVGGVGLKPVVEGVDLVRVITAQWLFVFFSFYLVSPEYFLMAVPGLVVVLASGRRWLVGGGVLLGLLSIPWGTNFAYGVANAIEKAGGASEVTGGKAAFVKIWNAAMPIDPAVGHVLGIVVFAVGLGGLAVWLMTPGIASRDSVLHEQRHEPEPAA